jgi:hypothetical protein
MRTVIACHECGVQQNGPPEIFFADYYDEHTIKTQCPSGHTVIAIVQNPKFETLLETGSDSLILGQTLQACAAFSTARERAFEFATQVLLRKLGVSREQFQAMFKDMANQSERQLGAFLATHLAATKSPFTPNKNISTFRNEVIHKGKIPRPENALSFCSIVFDEIHQLGETLRLHCKDQIGQVILEQNSLRVKKVAEHTSIATVVINAVYSIVADSNPRSFEEALAKYRTWKDEFSEQHIREIMKMARKAHPEGTSQQ